MCNEFKLNAGNVELNFKKVELHFKQELYSDVFVRKNNKTLGQTLLDKNYRHLEEITKSKYHSDLKQPLGSFLSSLKVKNDLFYCKFLNKYGDEAFSKFSIKDRLISNKRGLYIYAISDSVQYVGRCLNNFKKRINSGYGSISPKNCFLDGQFTDCHLNSLITEIKTDVSFYACELQDSDAQIKKYEKLLITALQPEWNVLLKKT